ncbi:unnamed protein product [Gongylonema pulchrum]|uniref:Uncharacterized protein n=1 Tax=Gongylonema pulchrum TaxID=637853 RepID=A0A183EGG1_9BILA|nr:unnamed protein product [Gongylonema pulchrum]
MAELRREWSLHHSAGYEDGSEAPTTGQWISGGIVALVQKPCSYSPNPAKTIKAPAVGRGSASWDGA